MKKYIHLQDIRIEEYEKKKKSALPTGHNIPRSHEKILHRSHT